MGDAGKAYTGNVSRSSVDSLEVPDGLRSLALKLLRYSYIRAIKVLYISGRTKETTAVSQLKLDTSRDKLNTIQKRESLQSPCIYIVSTVFTTWDHIGTYPQGIFSKGWTSRMSTTRQSPGSAPSTATGPERLWTRVRSTSRISSLTEMSCLSKVSTLTTWIAYSHCSQSGRRSSPPIPTSLDDHTSMAPELTHSTLKTYYSSC